MCSTVICRYAPLPRKKAYVCALRVTENKIMISIKLLVLKTTLSESACIGYGIYTYIHK
jgi:hypothetical protein